jgi:hypothetical protein
MATNDQMPNGNHSENGNTKEEEVDIIPLERCPHLYIKHTATKGNSRLFSSFPNRRPRGHHFQGPSATDPLPFPVQTTSKLNKSLPQLP